MKTYHSFAQVVNEQAAVKYAVGSKGEEVKKIQQKLIDLGLLTITNPTGTFGEKTKSAVQAFQSKNGLDVDGIVGKATYPKLMSKSSTAQPTKKAEPFTKYDFKPITADSFRQTAPMDTFAQYQIKPVQLDPEMRAKLAQAKISEQDFEQGSWWKRFMKKGMKSLPLHIRALLYYIAGRTSEMNEDELTPEERHYLYIVAKTYGLKNGFNYNVWKQVGAAGLPTAITKQGIEAETQKLAKSGSQQVKDLTAPNAAGQFMYTIGAVDKSNVKQTSPNTIEVKDNYDMNAIGKSKEELITALGDAFDSWTQGKASLYSIIRQAISLRELTGYPGYPVKFTITESADIA
jgi:hypothetical protein